MPDNSYIYVEWIGIQSLETVMMGGKKILAMLVEQPCTSILNSNKELIGPWNVAINWLSYRWAPQAQELGVKYYAHVLSPGVFGQRSFQLMQPVLNTHFKVKSFEDESTAEAWLQFKVS